MKQIFDSQWKDIIRKGAGDYGLDLGPESLDLMAMHAQELIRWNKKFNITSIVDPRQIATKHFIDSLALAPHVPENASVLDLGSGGGFPGFPLKVVRPDLKVVMADASRKRVSFLNFIVRQSGLESVKAVHVRAEALAEDDAFAGQFDVVTSRAFTALDRFVSLARPFLSNGGIILAMKGGAGEEEAGLLSETDYRISLIPYLLPLENHSRNIVRVMPVT
ncbi:MAG: 16S rRNA (guanine(527)-N(7))-methyltransferase RsmG [Desulfobacterium sp.]|nr:16S rRNA (guanine(527)-N(7))-methyltransferase RsmG [Desulfobacterium sp.]